MKTSTISIGSVAAVVGIIGTLYTMNMLPVTAETMDEHIQDEEQRSDEQDKRDAKQDLGYFYMQRREIRNELRDADPEDLPDIEEEMAQIQDDIDLAKAVLEEKD